MKSNTIKYLYKTASIFVILPLYLLGAIEKPDSKPNIIFILMDDVGMEMVNAYGANGLLIEKSKIAPYITPNIDEFAKQSMRFDNAFATPSCAPTRAQFSTGRYPFRTGITYPTLPNGPLSRKAISLATVLKNRGYHTGVAGKWNLTYGINHNKKTNEHIKKQYSHIKNLGFDEYFTFIGHTIAYGDPKNENDYLPFKTNQWALQFIDNAIQTKKPFFLQYSLGLIHSPYVATPLNPNENKYLYCYLDMVEYMDKMIGNILSRIKKNKLENNTLILLAGDNGSSRPFVSNFKGKPIRGGKLSLLDTGSRIPFLIRWPNLIKANSVYKGLTDFSDIYATFIDISGGKVPKDRMVDGKSFFEQLKGKNEPHRKTVYCQIQNRMFIRNDQYKLVISGGKLMKAGLYDVSQSPFIETFIPLEKQSIEQQQIMSDLQLQYDNLVKSNM